MAAMLPKSISGTNIESVINKNRTKDNMVEWPETNCEIQELNNSYVKLIINYKKEGKNDQYASLLATQDILQHYLKGLDENFVNRGEVFDKYTENAAKIDIYIMNEQIIPTLKEEYRAEFEENVIEQYKTVIKKDKDRLREIILDLLMEIMQRDSERFHYIATPKDTEYWINPMTRDSLFHANITPTLYDELLIESNSAIKRVMDKLINTSNMMEGPSRGKPRSADSEKTSKEKQRKTNQSIRKQQEEERWSHQLIEEFMQECYVSDKGSWISVSDLYSHYLKWLPQDKKPCPTANIFSMAIPKDKFEQKRMRVAGYYAKLKQTN